jgi:hypothetical protein
MFRRVFAKVRLANFAIQDSAEAVSSRAGGDTGVVWQDAFMGRSNAHNGRGDYTRDYPLKRVRI